MQIIKKLRDKLEDLNLKCNTYVCLKLLQNDGYSKWGIAEISKTPSGLELMINQGISETITVGRLKGMLDECREHDNIGYFLIEEEFDIQRGGDIDGYQIINGHLYLTSILFPRFV